MNFLSEKSLIIEYWTIIFPLLGTFLLFVYFRKKTKPNLLKDQLELNFEDDNNSDLTYDKSDITSSLEEKDHIPFGGVTITMPGGSHAFYEMVNNRRSIRKFSSKSIPFEVIENCVKAAGTAPSGAHTEPWTFCLISDPTVKSQVREIIEAEEFINYEQRMSKQWTADLRPLRTYHVKEYLTVVPYLILVFKQVYGIRKDGKRKQHYYNEISTSIAVGILISALQASGISSLVTTPLNCGPALRSLLNRPSNEKLLVLLPIGYAANDCTIPDLQRKDISEILVRY